MIGLGHEKTRGAGFAGGLGSDGMEVEWSGRWWDWGRTEGGLGWVKFGRMWWDWIR